MTGNKDRSREDNGQFAFEGGSGKKPPVSMRELFAPMIEIRDNMDPYLPPPGDTPNKIIETYKAFREAKANGTLLPPTDEEEESMMESMNELQPYLEAMGMLDDGMDF